ncbi:Six-hairpin glycosidase [Auricularia subglabra TFB-10046 SS5]|nr:Six-hairpin glycosidase [Auricularia subglabra TFB-10046 SS5]
MTLRSVLFSVFSLASTSLAAHPEYSRETIAKVRDNMIAVNNRPWEVGTMMEAITELETPHLAVFDAPRVPPQRGESLPPAAIAAMDKALAARPEGVKWLVKTAAVGDSASLGVTDVVAAVTTGEEKYATSATEQLDMLLNDVPHEGILISHRSEYFQAWADFIAMAPPFIAYSGVALGGSEGKDLVLNAYEQCKGYRDILRDPETNLWMHVLKGKWNDTGLWLTGNAWAVNGMLRVQQTIAKSEYAPLLQRESADLISWTNEILNATWSRQQENGGIWNYMDKENQFEDSAGTALLAATTYRLALISGSTQHIPAAEKALERMIELTDEDGWLLGATDPYNFARPAEGNTPDGHSPEAQSFVIMLDVAARNYYTKTDGDGLSAGAGVSIGL